MEPLHRASAHRAPVALAISLAFVAACGGGDGTGPAKSNVTSISLQFSEATLALGAVQSLGADFRDATGAVVTVVSDVKWTTSNASVATVDQDGKVSAVGLGGPVTIKVTAGTATATASFSVIPNKVTFPVTPTSIAVNRTLQLTATPVDIAGTPIPASLAPVTWTSSNPGVATVGASTGLLTGVAPGNVHITAEAAGQSAGLDFEVGVTSAYDGTWSGVDIAGSRPIEFVVLFGTIRNFRITAFLFTLPYHPSCQPSAEAIGGGPTAVIGGTTFAFTMTLPPTGTVSGTFTSATTMTGDHNGMNLGNFSCNLLATGELTTNTVKSANLLASAFSATRQ